MPTYNQIAIAVALLVASLPLLVFLWTLSLAIVSPSRFHQCTGRILHHFQPKNEDGEPIQIKLRYEYMVEGETFQGTRHFFGSLNTTDSALLDQYPAGSVVTVFYDPKKPGRSTLETGARPALIFWGCVALVAAILLGLATWIMAYAAGNVELGSTSSIL